jgi:predicted TIM-barrel fold metal-dependent hydrolase
MSGQDNILTFGSAVPRRNTITLDVNGRRIAAECRKLIVQTMPKLMGGLFENLDDALYEMANKSDSNALQNVYFDTAASPYLYDQDVYRVACEVVGSEKILFGSDYPLLGPTRYFAEMAAAGISGSDRERICGGNAARLLKL